MYERITANIDVGPDEREAAAELTVFRPDTIKALTARAFALGSDFDSARVKSNSIQVLAENSKRAEELTREIPDMFAPIRDYILAGLNNYRVEMQRELSAADQTHKQNQRRLAELQAALKIKTEAFENESRAIDLKSEQLYAELKVLNKRDREMRVLDYSAESYEESVRIRERKRSLVPELESLHKQRLELSQPWYEERDLLNADIYITKKEFETSEKDLARKFEWYTGLLSDWIDRIIRDLKECEQGIGLNSVDLLAVDTKARVKACAKCSDGEISKFAPEFDRLHNYHFSSENLRPMAKSLGRRNQASGLYFIDGEPNPQPALFFTGQILESVNDSVSRNFVSCALVEVFSPKSSRHVAFHLAPLMPKILVGNNLPTFNNYSPAFFHQKLEDFLRKEGCDYEDLEVKIVSGVSVPPDEIEASLKALGVDEDNMKTVQFPVSKFTALTLADQKTILIEGRKVEFLPQDVTREGKIYRTVGGNRGRGYSYQVHGDQERFVA